LWGFGGIFVAKQNKNHDKTGGNRELFFNEENKKALLKISRAKPKNTH